MAFPSNTFHMVYLCGSSAHGVMVIFNIAVFLFNKYVHQVDIK